jgi:hypothetical protein
MAPSIVIGHDDYAELRHKEEVILASAMNGVRVRGIASDDFSWADRIATLLGSSTQNHCAAEVVTNGTAKANAAIA